MARITLGGNPVETSGDLPAIGSTAPQFNLTTDDLGSAALSDFAGSRIVLNIFPSIDTGICSASARRFNAEASKMNNTKVLCISRDLPFALKRFCAAEGIENVIMLTDYKKRDFGRDYQVEMLDGAMEGLLSRAVIVLDEDHKVIYTEQVPEIGQEPDYESALSVL